MTNADIPGRAWSAAFASAPHSAMDVYAEVMVDGLPVAHVSFDVATCQQGLQFFPDQLAALAEMRRALRPGGRIGVAVWKRVEECPLSPR
jgi:ubiquinone/menaquinone biosynthesis C-methylase UbiE